MKLERDETKQEGLPQLGERYGSGAQDVPFLVLRATQDGGGA